MESGCDICGCTQTNLVDGFYYCAECGTQDMNIQETLVEMVALAEGTIALGSRKRIVQIPQAKEEEMTDAWYKWHSLNFLLRGLANELVELGAATSFKTKLLWLWTRYMKKYQNKADFGLALNEKDERKKGEFDSVDNEEDMNTNDFTFDEDDGLNNSKNPKKHDNKPDIKKINISLVVTFLYVALNLDQSHIQLTHLIRFIKEGRLSLTHWQKFVPKELKPKKLHYCLLFNRHWFLYSYSSTLRLAMQLFKELDLGDPLVPDLRLLVDQYMQELYLPNDMKPLILSLMHYRSFDYLDINVKFYETGRIPSYELYVMAHILCAIKICFGIDGEYELKVSDAVDKVNKLENHPKSYNSEPSERLFSFREWCSYIQFRKSMLWMHSLYLGAPNYCDMDDYVTFEHLSEKPDYKKTLQDEIARDIINKLPEVDVNVIPKSEFPVTTTPHTTYTRVIINHQQDPNVKQLLSEDFTQYSLKYIIEDMFLVDPDSPNPQNSLTGVNREYLKEYIGDFLSFENFALGRYSKKMVFVRDCDNHNWLLTQRPKLEQVTEKNQTSIEDKLECGSTESDFKETSETSGLVEDQDSTIDMNGDHDKPYESDSKETSAITVDNGIITDLNNIYEMKINKNKQIDNDLLNIPDESENENIYDDNFEVFDAKIEDPESNEVHEPVPEMPVNDEVFPILDIFRHDRNYQEYRQEKGSDESSEDSIHLNPESLNRVDAIKELVIHACNKYKISLPGQYIHQPRKRTVRKKKIIQNLPPNVPRVNELGLIKRKINGFVAEYHKKIQQDVLMQMSNLVQSAISDFNERNPDSLTEIEKPIVMNGNATLPDHDEMEHNNTSSLSSTNQHPAVLDEIDDQRKHDLFDMDSDGEIKVDEFLPKKNLKFDEKTHDVSQLYVKRNEETSVLEIELNPNLCKIIDQKIKGKEEDNPLSSPERKESDSEEEISLSMLQELVNLREQLTKQAKHTKGNKLNPLIKSSIPSYNYWMRHYKTLMQSFAINQQRFATEIDDVFPTTFKIVIYECADVVGYHPHYLYRYLQRVESSIKDKYVNKKRLVPCNFEVENIFKRTKNDIF